MIYSNEFSFDENSVWDPKAIRQLLIISEDQLNILNNIPEWTKEKDNYYSRIKINDSCINTQVQQNPRDILLRNPEVINHNIELFDKNLDCRENIIQGYKLKALKFSKSISLFEIDKISENSHLDNQSSTALSLPNLSLFSKDFSIGFDNKSYLSKESDLSTLSSQAVLKTGKSRSFLENTNMEVTQLPAIVPQIIKNSENFVIVEKTISPVSQTNQSSDNSSNSCDLLSTLVGVNKSDHINSVATNKPILVEIGQLDSSNEKAAFNDNKQMIIDKDNSVLQKNIVKLSEPTDSNLHEKMEIDLSAVRKSSANKDNNHETSENIQPELEALNINKKNELQGIGGENVVNNSSSLKEDKNSNINIEDKVLKVNENSVEISKQLEEKELKVSLEENVTNNDANSLKKDEISNIDTEGKILNEFNETSVEISKHPSGVDPKLCEPKVTEVSSNELKSKITDISPDYGMNAEIVLKTACRGDGEAVTNLQNIPLKRKSESKARSTKRSKSSRDKQGCSEERSIKKAGGISYSPEDTKIMFDLLKLFL